MTLAAAITIGGLVGLVSVLIAQLRFARQEVEMERSIAINAAGHAGRLYMEVAALIKDNQQLQSVCYSYAIALQAQRNMPTPSTN